MVQRLGYTLYDHQPKQRLTFVELVTLEPRLGILLAEIRDRRRRSRLRGWQRLHVWSREFKPRMSSLVGWYRDEAHLVLSTSEAYEVAYDALCRAWGV